MDQLREQLRSDIRAELESFRTQMTNMFDEMFVRKDEVVTLKNEQQKKNCQLLSKSKVICEGFEKPSTIQQRGSEPGLDVIDQQAQSTTGKIQKSCSMILAQLDYSLVQCQALVPVPVPTWQLARDIEKVMLTFGDNLGVKVHVCLGGNSIHEDERILSSGVHVVVGTPDRVFDMLRRRSLLPDHIKMYLLDEAFEMLSPSFKNQIYDIYKLLPPKFLVRVFSATMTPEWIMVKPYDLILNGIRQFYVDVEVERCKLEMLFDLYEFPIFTFIQSVIFVNTSCKVDLLTDKFERLDYRASATHGDMEERERDMNLVEFRIGASRVLITTDLSARGTNVEQVPLVINYDLPTQPEDYLGRIRHIGTKGRKCVVFNFVTMHDEEMLSDIKNFYNVVLEELPSYGPYTWMFCSSILG